MSIISTFIQVPIFIALVIAFASSIQFNDEIVALQKL